MAWAAINNYISSEIISLYSAIFWTLGYDTIYGAQDMSDDEIIGLKSTSIKFKNNIKLFVFSYLFINFIIIYFLRILDKYFFTFIIFFLTLIYQIYKFNKNNLKVV